MPYLLYSPAAVEARITSRTMRAKLTREHIAWAAAEFAGDAGCLGAVPTQAITIGAHARRSRGDIVAGEREHEVIAGRTALLIWETESGVVPS